MRRKILMLLLITICYLSMANAQQLRPFHAGDRVVFTGNSITDGGRYHSYIWLYYLTRFPAERITIFNAGIGGDVAQQMYERLQTDVFNHHPTVVTLGFGMNDTGYQLVSGPKADSIYTSKIAQSRTGFLNVVNEFKKHPGVQFVMLGSSPYDGSAKTKALNLYHKNEALQQVIAFQQQQAQQNHWPFIDFNAPMQAINQREQQRDSAFTMEGTDRIHPTTDGHMVIAYLFLKAQGLAGKKVAAINVDATGKLLTAENCTVSNLKTGNQGISFSYQAKSLPYPIDTLPRSGTVPRSQADALKLVPFIQEFNQEILSVKGLEAGKSYNLKIDDTNIGAWPAADFAAGINLAVLHSTPQYQQALAVMHLNEERWSTERRLREYYWLHYSILKPKGMLFNDTEPIADSLRKYARKDFFVAATLGTYNAARFKAVRDTWQKEIDLLTDQMYRINQPVAHTFTITPVN